MKLTSESKFFLGVIITTIVIIVIGMFVLNSPVQTFSKDDLIKETSITKGNKNANVYLVEFSDFQCPACKAFKPVVDEILLKYKDDVVFSYRHYPLPQHPQSQKAAEAFEIANEKGKAWEMYDYLFENQEAMTDKVIIESGKNIGLDDKDFQKSLSSGKYKDKVFNDKADGNKFAVNSTPTFFLNGKKLTLQTYDDLKKEVEQAIVEGKE